MTDAKFKVLCDLRAIPQRNAHFMLLYGEAVAVAEELVAEGLVVKGQGYQPGEAAYRLNKPGRQCLLGEWLRRGKPTRKEIFGDG